MSTRSDFKGDYMGFTFNGVHSSELGIVRTSNGSRFDENLLPTIQDKTVQVPGGDGTYYFGSYYTQRPITIQFAFDSLGYEQLERLRTHFGDKKIHELVFDEAPYKAYNAKVTGTATIKHVPFAENYETEVVYKGEGSIQFTCYSPYAICKRKYLSLYPSSEYPNRNLWARGSGMLLTQENYDIVNNGVIKLYNPGVKPSDWSLRLPSKSRFGVNVLLCKGTINDIEQSEVLAGIKVFWGSINMPEYIVIDSKTNLIKAGDDIYNEYIIEGDFFQIPMHTNLSEDVFLFMLELDQDGNLTNVIEDASIDYNYYYF